MPRLAPPNWYGHANRVSGGTQLTKLVIRKKWNFFAMCIASGAAGFAAVVLLVINTPPGQ
jgi:hypothetical protein